MSARPAPRFVVLAAAQETFTRLEVAPNGSGRSVSDLSALATAAAILPRVTPRGVWIRTVELPDFEALCEVRGVVVQRRRQR